MPPPTGPRLLCPESLRARLRISASRGCLSHNKAPAMRDLLLSSEFSKVSPDTKTRSFVHNLVPDFSVPGHVLPLLGPGGEPDAKFGEISLNVFCRSRRTEIPYRERVARIALGDVTNPHQLILDL